jgi:hypothetical protein
MRPNRRIVRFSCNELTLTLKTEPFEIRVPKLEVGTNTTRKLFTIRKVLYENIINFTG